MPHPYSSKFDLGLNWKHLTEKDKKSARFLEKHIHKIRFNSPSTVPVSNLPQIVRTYFSEPETLVAYKGGHFEKRSTGPTRNSIRQTGKL
jgi:hypothetical protein